MGEFYGTSCLSHKYLRKGARKIGHPPQTYIFCSQITNDLLAMSITQKENLWLSRLHKVEIAGTRKYIFQTDLEFVATVTTSGCVKILSAV